MLCTNIFKIIGKYCSIVNVARKLKTINLFKYSLNMSHKQKINTYNKYKKRIFYLLYYVIYRIKISTQSHQLRDEFYLQIINYT